MNKGTIIFLSGLTSTGKTSMIRELIDRREYLFYVLGFDLFEDTIPYYASDRNACYSKAIISMYHAARSLSDQGQDVIIDGLIFNIEGLEAHYKTLRGIFEGYPLKIVHMDCPLEVLRQRNISRGDRRENQSLEQSKLAAADVDYFLEIDSSKMSTPACADELLAHIPLRKFDGR